MRILTILSLALIAATSVQAASPLTVQMDQSQVMLLAQDPGSIIVGNPSIADVTLNGRQLFIHGHAFGETNLLIFDAFGNKIGDFALTVSNDTSNQVSVFSASNASPALRRTYSCAPNCEVNMMVGDDPIYFDLIANANRKKADLANGVKTSDLNGKAGPVTLPDGTP
jgi:hypothetical protein